MTVSAGDLNPVEAVDFAESDVLRDVSAGGLRFAETIYDRERYQAVQDVAVELLVVSRQLAAKH